MLKSEKKEEEKKQTNSSTQLETILYCFLLDTIEANMINQQAEINVYFIIYRRLFVDGMALFED